MMHLWTSQFCECHLYNGPYHELYQYFFQDYFETPYLSILGCLSQYADDTVLILNGSESSMRSAFKNLDTFANISGLKVNVEKTNAMWIGSKKNSVDKLCKEIKVNWVDNKGSFKALGVAFSTDLDSMVSLNYNKAIESLRKQYVV